MIRRHRIATLGAAAIVIAWADAAAFAHAELRRAAPAAGATVSSGPAEVLVNFSEPLEPAFSSLMVRDVAGKRVDKADAHLDQTDRTTMRVSLQSLAEGAYTVTWRAVTADTHRTTGSFMFHVGGSQ
jgi:methionine-rich copper-binding protein CopC